MVIRATDYPTDATYWAPGAPDGFGGYAWTKSTIKVRWEARTEKFTDQVGDEHVSRAVVFVLADLDLSGYLYLGVSAQSNPDDQAGAYQIRQFIKVPDLRSVEVERRVYL